MKPKVRRSSRWHNIEGVSLREKTKSGSLDPEEAVGLVTQVAEGLKRAHQKEPDRRYPDLDAMLGDLKKLQSGDQVQPVEGRGAPLWRRLAPVAAVAVLVAAVAVIWPMNL